jgi:diaminopimelate epimerase
MGIPFRKMHGLGNDFVVLDARRDRFALGARQAAAIADRKTGIGCDQLIVLKKPTDSSADIAMQIFNADGSEPGACGNATRCIARLVLDETGRREVVIETPSGLVSGAAQGDLVTVDMGKARTDWREIPLAQALDTLALPIESGPLKTPVATSMGNPHATFFVDDAESVPLATLGPALEHHALFPERVNVGVAQILDRSHLRLRVWERGTGITLACGTGACAAAVAAVRRGLADRKVEVRVDGGVLGIEVRADGTVLMTGPVATAFTGELAPELLGPERSGKVMA